MDPITRTYATRDEFLAAIVRCLDESNGADLMLGKYSPAPLPASGPFMQGLRRQVDSGGSLVLLLREYPESHRWLDGVIELFADQDRVCIALLRDSGPSLVPAFVIGSSDVFLHLTWPSAGCAEIPYLGLHLQGRSQDVAQLVSGIRRSILGLVSSTSSLILKRGRQIRMPCPDGSEVK